MSGDKKIRVGSRKSELALIQTRHVISLLSSIYLEKEFEIVTMSTLGDRILDKPLPKIGEKSLFTQELEAALATGCVDFVVHSLKDLPTTLPEGMAIGAVLQREDPRDALVVRQGSNSTSLAELAESSVVGTSSLRRTAQLSRLYPHLRIESIRGNLNTRLRKLDAVPDKFQAIVLAQAGLQRMGWQERITCVLECDEMMYAVGQGALAVECRENDVEILSLLHPLHHADTLLRVIAERSFLRTLGGGCSAPVAVTSTLAPIDEKFSLKLSGAVWSLDGQVQMIESDKCTVEIKKSSEDSKQEDKPAVCPLGFTTEGGETSDILAVVAQKNILNLTASSSGITKCPYEIPCKRRKMSSDEEKNDTNNLKINDLSDDPHDHCPVNIPVGLDFMGKCPFLDSQCSRKCPVNAEVLNSRGENVTGRAPVTECPFLRIEDRKTQTEAVTKPAAMLTITVTDPTARCPYRDGPRLYAGIVPCTKTPLRSLNGAERLGVGLAEALMKKGALHVMEEAQATIRA